MKGMPKVVDTKPVFIAWTNTDCTEGRGSQIPLVVCDSEATAIRIGKGKSVQGSDCLVTEGVAVKLEGSGSWLVPWRIEGATKEDIAEETRLEAKREALQRKKEALERARQAGLSEADIEALQ